MKIEVGNISVKDILFSGACFRAYMESDGSITDILNDRVVNIKQDGEYIIVKSSNYDNLEDVIREYFDLNRDYNYINRLIINNNEKLASMVLKCSNYRILNQNSFEMCISYIISQNNNVKRISNSINKLCELYGKKVVFNNNIYYLFPSYEDIKDIDLDTLKSIGVGFRDKYIINFLDYYPNMKDINTLSTEDAIKELMIVKGIGLKVASCILLFGYKRLDVFPIDTWVRKYISNNYNIKDNIKDISEFSKENFKEYSGLVIQYMYHSERNVK